MEIVWFCLVAVMIAMYVVLDGFDLGAGAVHLFVARTDAERRAVLRIHRTGLGWQRSLAAGRRRHAVFQLSPRSTLRASADFTCRLMIVLWLLILRRNRHRDSADHVQSLVWQPLLGCRVLARQRRCCDLLRRGSRQRWFGAFRWTGPALFSCRCGPISPSARTPAAAFWIGTPSSSHIAALATLVVSRSAVDRAEDRGDLALRARRTAARAWWGLAASVILITFVSFRIQPHLKESFEARPWGYVFPHPGGWRAWWAPGSMNSRLRELGAFLCSCLFILGMLTSVAFGVYPYVLPSNSGRRALADGFERGGAALRPQSRADLVHSRHAARHQLLRYTYRSFSGKVKPMVAPPVFFCRRWVRSHAPKDTCLMPTRYAKVGQR